MNSMNVALSDTKLVTTILQNYNLICFDMLESYDKETADDKILFGECLAIVEITINDIDLPASTTVLDCVVAKEICCEELTA